MQVAVLEEEARAEARGQTSVRLFSSYVDVLSSKHVRHVWQRSHSIGSPLSLLVRELDGTGRAVSRFCYSFNRAISRSCIDTRFPVPRMRHLCASHVPTTQTDLIHLRAADEACRSMTLLIFNRTLHGTISTSAIGRNRNRYLSSRSHQQQPHP